VTGPTLITEKMLCNFARELTGQKENYYNDWAREVETRGGAMEKAEKMKKELRKNPFPTVDIIIKIRDEDGKPGFILIKRKNPPCGWALPGGFVEYGETLEEAAVREAREETSLDIELLAQFHTYSDPGRDPRFHTISTIFIAQAEGRPKAQDDAQEIGIFTATTRPHPLAFDHERILTDYFCTRKTRRF